MDEGEPADELLRELGKKHVIVPQGGHGQHVGVTVSDVRSSEEAAMKVAAIATRSTELTGLPILADTLADRGRRRGRRLIAWTGPPCWPFGPDLLSGAARARIASTVAASRVKPEPDEMIRAPTTSQRARMDVCSDRQVTIEVLTEEIYW
ncbi:MAG TPA: hypothetical protein VF731_13915 [Solirubrobacterales bacterium]